MSGRLSDAMVTLSLDGTVRAWSPAAERIFGRLARDAIGQRFSELATGEMQRSVDQLRSAGHADGFVTRCQTDEGVSLELSVEISAVCDASGKMIALNVRARPLSTQLKVLVVDDNQDATVTMGLLLESHGYRVRTANDGRSALEQTKAFDPDVVLLDLGMPEMDGFEVARLILEHQRSCTPPRTPLLIAITGYCRPGDQERTRAAGFAYHLVKPVDFKTIERVLNAQKPEE
jgi:PAS domain S-box-containing protein